MARVERAGDPGGPRRWVLQLPPLEAKLVSSLPQQLSDLLNTPGGNQRVIDRLFPPAYADAREQAEHRQLLGDSLLEARRELLTAVRAQLAASPRDKQGLRLQFDEAGMDLWLRFLNDIRLVLATDLGIEKNLSEINVPRGHPDAARHSLLVYLTGLEAALVDSLCNP
jgi:hypothetical protein